MVGVLRTAATSAAMIAAPGLVAAHVHDAARRMRGLAPDRQTAFEVLVERHAVVRAGRGCAPAPRAPSRARPSRRRGRRRPRSCRAHAPPACRLRRPPRRCRPAPRRSTRLRRSARRSTMVTGRGASFSAQNRPASPPPTMTTSSDVATCGHEISSRVRHGGALVEHAGRDGAQLFRWIIRSTERRAFAAIIGSITTSSFRYTRLSRIFGSVMRFMCGQRLHG